MSRNVLFLAGIALSAVACGGDGTNSNGGGDGTGSPVEGDVFGYMQYAEGPEGGSTIVTLTREVLPADAPELEPSKGYPFEGEPALVDRFVIEVEGVEYTQWTYDANLELHRHSDKSISFAQFPLGEDGASFFNSWKANDRAWYLMYDMKKRVVWDPVDMVIVKDADDSALEPELDGLTLHNGGNRGSLDGGGQPTQIGYFYKDADWWEFSQKSVIALYDQETHEEQKLIDVPCPGLAVASRDEQGNTYWGTWDYKGILALFGLGPTPCIARITPDGELDEDFTTDLLDLTGGHYGKYFTYVRDGWGLMMVFDHEATGVDFSDTSQEPSALETWWTDDYWRLWYIDFKNGDAGPLPDLADHPVDEIYVKTVAGTTYLTVTSEFWEKEDRYILNADRSVTPNEYTGLWHRFQ